MRLLDPGPVDVDRLVRAATHGYPRGKPRHLVFGQAVELGLVESGKILDAIASQVGNEDPALLVQRRMANREQKELRSEPAAAIDDDVVRPSGADVDDESVDFAKLFAVDTVDLQSIEIQRTFIEVVGGHVSHPRARMIHRRLQSREHRARITPLFRYNPAAQRFPGRRTPTPQGLS